MECPECRQTMKNLGNLTNIVMTSNPPQWVDTWICENCKIRREQHCSGAKIQYHDLSAYKIIP